MRKIYKHKIYKKYLDELWGKLIFSRGFSYNKKLVLLAYKKKIIKFRKLRRKYSYFRINFVKDLKISYLLHYLAKRQLRIRNYFLKYSSSVDIHKLYTKTYVKRVKPKNLIFRVIKANIQGMLNKNSSNVDRWRVRSIYKNLRYRLVRRFVPFKRLLNLQNEFGSFADRRFIQTRRFLQIKEFAAFGVGINSFTRKFLFNKNFNVKPVVNFGVIHKYLNNRMLKQIHLEDRLTYLLCNQQYVFALLAKNLLYLNMTYRHKRRFKVKRIKEFFFLIHIPSPQKKKDKQKVRRSFYLKHSYYRKVSRFLGFVNPFDYVKYYENVLMTFGNNTGRVLLSVEAKLDVLLFRFNFFPSIYFVQRLISSGNVYVNNRTMLLPHYVIMPGEIVSFNRKYFKYAYFSIKNSLKNGSKLVNNSSFMEVDYKLLVAMVIRYPSYKDLTLPMSFDLSTNFPSFFQRKA